MIRDAVQDKRLARPVVIPIKVDLTHYEKKIYVGCSIKIRNISGYLHASDPKSIASMLRRKLRRPATTDVYHSLTSREHSHRFWDLAHRFMPNYHDKIDWLEVNGDNLISPFSCSSAISS